MLVLDHDAPNLHGLACQDVLNTWIFAGNDNLVKDVYVAGRQVVQNGRHRQQEQIEKSSVTACSNCVSCRLLVPIKN